MQPQSACWVEICRKPCGSKNNADFRIESIERMRVINLDIPGLWPSKLLQRRAGQEMLVLPPQLKGGRTAGLHESCCGMAALAAGECSYDIGGPAGWHRSPREEGGMTMAMAGVMARTRSSARSYMWMEAAVYRPPDCLHRQAPGRYFIRNLPDDVLGLK